MALPLLGPLVSMVPLLKVLALGSVKFVGVAIGAAVAPVLTANFLVNLSAGTPLKYARFRHHKGLFSDADLKLIEDASDLINQSITNQKLHLSRSEAREFLKGVLVETAVSMKDSVVRLPSRIALVFQRLITWCKGLFSA